MKSYEHINPQTSDRILLRQELDETLGVYRVFIEGDHGQKPLYTGIDRSEAERVYGEAATALKKSIEGV